jgi:hypothetical protein
LPLKIDPMVSRGGNVTILPRQAKDEQKEHKDDLVGCLGIAGIDADSEWWVHLTSPRGRGRAVAAVSCLQQRSVPVSQGCT